MFLRFFLSLALVFTHCTPLYAQSMKLSRPDVIESQDSKVNYVINPSGFKNALNVTTSNATIAQDTSGATDLLDGIASLVCDASAQNGYCEWDSKTIQEGDKTGNCEGKAVFKGDASLYKLQVTDGSNVLTSSSVLSNATDWTEVSINYPCGATRKVRLTQTEAGTGAAVNIGRVYHGRATNLGVMNANADCRTVTMTSSWVSNTTVTAIECRQSDRAFYRVKAAVAGGAPTAATLTFTLPTGRVIDTTKLIGTAAAISPLGEGRANDSGANIYGVGVSYSNTTTVTLRSAQAGATYVDYNTAVTNTTPFSFNDGDSVEIDFEVPIVGWGSQPVVNDNTTPWYVDAAMDGGNPSLGVAAVSSYTEMVHTSLALGPRSGSAAAGIMCSGTNAATAPSTSLTTCAAGDESVGINFSIPKAGAYEVCFYGAHFIGADSAGDEIATAFQLIETPTNAQTLTLEGGTRFQSQYLNPAAAAGQVTHPITNCSIFNWASAGTKGVRLMYEQAVASTPANNFILADASASIGQRNMRWTVKPVTAASPMPLLVGSVTSNSSGLERIERADLNCDAGSAITSQSGSWVSSIGNVSGGACAVTLAAGMFSAAPSCVVSGQQTGSTPLIINASIASSTSVTIDCATDAAAACTGYDVSLICAGPR